MAIQDLISKHVWSWLWLNDTNSSKDIGPRNKALNDGQQDDKDRVEVDSDDEEESEDEDCKKYNEQDEESDEIEKLRSKMARMRAELDILDDKLDRLRPRGSSFATGGLVSLPDEGKLTGPDVVSPSSSLSSPAIAECGDGTIKARKEPVRAKPNSVNRRYQKYTKVSPRLFSVGDIGWFPILRPSVSPSSSDIETQFGAVRAKVYPIVIVETLADCMIGLIISTASGNVSPINATQSAREVLLSFVPQHYHPVDK